VFLPLIAPGLAAGWLYVFVVATRELSASIVLYSPGNEVLSVAIWDYYASGRFPELAALGVMMVVALGGLVALAYGLSGALGGRERGVQPPTAMTAVVAGAER
jgi:iron(III) transport system permease protein